MLLAAATSSPRVWWYLTRGTGAVALILLTISVALGVANLRRMGEGQVPRFVLQGVHRNVGLLGVAFVAIHVITTLLDGFAPISILDAVIPFRSPYRPVWLGLGTTAFDLMLAVVITSLVRRRIGHRGWRATHWLSYASWPLALVHGFGTGSDAKTGWLMTLSVACLLIVLGATAIRIRSGWPDHLGARVAASLGCAAVPIGLLIWLPGGPLGSNWSRRAGTPASLLARLQPAPASSRPSTTTAAAAPATGSFQASATGTVRQGESGDGQSVIDISLNLSGTSLSALRFRLIGEPAGGGGVEMTSSQVFLGTAANPDQYTGQITALQGTDVAAQVSDSQGGRYSIVAQLQIDPGSGTAAGTVSVTAR